MQCGALSAVAERLCVRSAAIGLNECRMDPAGCPGIYTYNNCSDLQWCRLHGTGGAYGRWTAWNHTHLLYEHVENNGKRVGDAFTIVQPRHGPFPPARRADKALVRSVAAPLL